MIQTKKKSRWRGQELYCIGTFGQYYICKIGKRQFARVHKSEVAI